MIAGRVFASPLALAPMAGLTDIIWRKLLDELGGIAFMVTELISAEAVCRKSSRTKEMIEEFGGRTPQFLQLFGSDADALCQAARIIESETGYAGIDLNLGCPARKVIKKGAGSALLRDLPRLGRLVRQLRREVKGILTAKIRLGLTEVTALETARVLQEEGIDALAVHFRLQQQGYGSPADWSMASEIKSRLRIPLIGNGDIDDEATALRRLQTVDGLLIGRASMGDPLLFARMNSLEPLPDLRQVMGRFFELTTRYLPPERRVNRLKAQSRFLKGRRRSCRSLRSRINESKEFSQACENILALIDEQEASPGV